ncbi:MAG: hypothetical protein M0P91_04650 [Sulfuricurvum sp.]|jgi:hypothetical protein|uniref:hypothetical protein n=1 Tax=Sulfuricurvum sp. TaxID=2025608 RepID=UPI0025DF2655|nr:hypothetical protein [Sulfuricurvum sp.]MCK9372465.1 hypothetical protein [Sulfuricurvum sp.]
MNKKIEGKVWDLKKNTLFVHIEKEERFLFFIIDRKLYPHAKLFDYINFDLEKTKSFSSILNYSKNCS